MALQAIPESELILNPDVSDYHLNQRPEHITETIITVGDPERVAKVSRHFDSIEIEVSKREFITHTGYYKGKRITVISTGMGTDNIDILMNELDALVNVDLLTRLPVAEEDRITLQIIRIGTSGALQTTVPLGSHLASNYAIGLDSLMQFYPLEQTAFESAVAEKLKIALNLPYAPYCVQGSEMLLKRIAFDMIPGNTVTCPGFYAPQGRVVRIPLKNENLIQAYHTFQHEDLKLTNFEMETAGYYALGRLLGHEMLSVNAMVADRINHRFAENADEAINDLILKVLDRI
jgi:uridine phosphorylase